MIKSNDDIFAKQYIPFAEAFEGDFFVLNTKNNVIYCMVHDFNDDEKCTYKVSNNITDFFMAIQLMNPTKIENKKYPVIYWILFCLSCKTLQDRIYCTKFIKITNYDNQ